MWGFTPKECELYIDQKLREELFREAVIGFLVPKDKDQMKIEDEYCRACRKARSDADCSTCSRKIAVKESKDG